MSFQEIEHTADRAFRVTGRNMAELLENAARTIQAVDRPGTMGRTLGTREIQIEGIDRESLLVNWLNEILYLEQAHGLTCEQFEIIELKDDHLRARVETRECDRNYSQIKAVTFHNLEIRESSEGVEAEIVVDV